VLELVPGQASELVPELVRETVLVPELMRELAKEKVL